MYFHLQIIGYILFGLAVLHLFFPRYFSWRKELRPLSLINRQMMYVHTFFIALMILLIALLCLTSYQDLVATSLGRRLCLGLGIFWSFRLLVQFVGYSPRLWRGKRFETSVHILFTLLWSYVSAVFVIIYFK